MQIFYRQRNLFENFVSVFIAILNTRSVWSCANMVDAPGEPINVIHSCLHLKLLDVLQK